MRVAAFADIEAEFMNRVRRIVWCNLATVDAKNRVRSRILHPIWEGATGWIATHRASPKAAHLAHNPHVSLSYWDQQHEQIYAECTAAWIEDAGEKRRVWDLFKQTPPPLGYDLAFFWMSPDDPAFGLLKLRPWRIELWALADMMHGKPAVVWWPGEERLVKREA